MSDPDDLVSVYEGANITEAHLVKNILLDEMTEYTGLLNNDGLLLLSGFYTSDIDDLLARSKELGFAEVKKEEKERWAVLLLRKG